MDKEIISLLVFGSLAALSTWLNKRRQDRAQRGQLPPFKEERDASQPPPVRRPSSWEEELRKLLEGETTPAPPPPPHREPIQRPTPVVRPAPAARPVPPPIMVETPVPVFIPPARPASVVAPPTAELLQQAQAQQEEARRILMQAEQRVSSVLQHAQLPPAIAPVSGSRIRNLLHDREAVRTAFVTSLVFGSPKGLADQ